MLDAGKLNHRLSLQSQSLTQDAETGEMVPGWSEVAQLWGHVDPVSAREFIQSAAGHTEVTARITIRYRAGIDTTMRIVHRGKIYNIQGVLADKESGLEYLTLPVSEGVNDGR